MNEIMQNTKELQQQLERDKQEFFSKGGSITLVEAKQTTAKYPKQVYDPLTVNDIPLEEY